MREAISILDLEVIMRPCPKDGVKWRPQAIALGGKSQFPFLVDANYSKTLYESDAIIQYLYDAYGPGKRYSCVYSQDLKQDLTVHSFSEYSDFSYQEQGRFQSHSLRAPSHRSLLESG